MSGDLAVCNGANGSGALESNAVGGCRAGDGHDDWRRDLEVIGAELFQRYRKRLLLPGIALDIHRDYPGLGLVDVLVRVHAGRRLLRSGGDFRALQAIRCGAWQREVSRAEAVRAGARPAAGRCSRLLVALGGTLFGGFCLLSLLAVGGVAALGAGALGLVGALGWRRYRRASGHA